MEIRRAELWMWRVVMFGLWGGAGIAKLVTDYDVALVDTIGWTEGGWHVVRAGERAVPWIECLIAVAWLAGVGVKSCVAITIGLCALFIVVVVNMPGGTLCPCFGDWIVLRSRAWHVAVLAVAGMGAWRAGRLAAAGGSGVSVR